MKIYERAHSKEELKPKLENILKALNRPVIKKIMLKHKKMVVHCKKEPYDVYVGRPSKWGNPFVIGKDGTREEVVKKYEQWILQQPELLKNLPELKGKILSCWCAPAACHADVLVRLAND